MLSTCTFMRASAGLFFRLLPNCEQGILKTNEPILMQIGKNGPRGKTMKL